MSLITTPGLSVHGWVCVLQYCIVLFPLAALDGNWGEWSQWSTCTRTCGGGEQQRTRECNNPAPANGGRECEGAFRQSDRLCSYQGCPGANDMKLLKIKSKFN